MTTNLTETVNESNVFTFGNVDYVVFVAMLGVSTGIGIYFGFFAHGSDTTDEYLLGGKRMKTLPIAISLVASQLSGLAVMSIPAEVYSFGINFAFSVMSIFAVIPVLCYLVIPVFYNNNISNCYEYLQMRFNKQIRQIITVSFILTVFLYLPVVMFMPSLAFSQVTGINIHLINAIVCSICVLYTMLGGIKAVVWTDVVQGTIMLGSSILIVVMGVVQSGGTEKVIDYAAKGKRLHINTQLDLETRSTMWNCFLGGFCMWASHVGFNQSCVQRIVALPSLARARRSLYIFGVGFFGIMLLNCLIGIVIFAKYHDCDPIASSLVEKADKIVPFFVQDIVGNWKGMPGVFISCVFSASLSTISANLNSLSGIFYFDYVKPFVRHTEARANFFMKVCVVVIGIYCVCAGLIVERFKSIMQVMITVNGVTHGAVFGTFLLGLLAPRVNGKVALFSLVGSMVGMLVVVSGAQMKITSRELFYEPLPTWTDGCKDVNFTTTEPEMMKRVSVDDEKFSLFKISFYWYALMGALLVWGIAFPLSYIFPSTEKVDLNLLSPIARSWSTQTPSEAEAMPLQNLKQ